MTSTVSTFQQPETLDASLKQLIQPPIAAIHSILHKRCVKSLQNIRAFCVTNAKPTQTAQRCLR